jgi:hypothetical protein
VPRPRFAGALARRAAISFAWAVGVAVMLIGLATLMPMDGDFARYSTFVDALVLMLPLVLAGGFHWEDPAGGHLRTALWVTAGACLVVALAPWPDPLHDLRHGHAGLLVLFALAAGVAVRLTTIRPALTEWLGVSGE